MITIVNLDEKERSTYEVRINNDVICTFQHNRAEGLAVCLYKASQAVEMCNWEKTQAVMDALKPRTKEIPSYADVLTLDEFEASVKCGCFIDYDGFGQLSDGKEVFLDNFVKPSTFNRDSILKEATHVVWYNR